MSRADLSMYMAIMAIVAIFMLCMGGCVGADMRDHKWRTGSQHCFLDGSAENAVCYKAVKTLDLGPTK